LKTDHEMWEGMPVDIVSPYVQLYNQAVSLFAYFQVHQDLFGSSENIRNQKMVAASAFMWIYYAMTDAIILGICRLTDKSTTGKKENLTLERMLDLVEYHPTQPKDVQDLRKTLDKLTRRSQHLRDLRNQQIGHLDLSTLLDQSKQSVQLETDEIKQILDQIAEVLNGCQMPYNGISSSFDPILPGNGKCLQATIDYYVRTFQR
jgi:hypothetical protein